MLEKMILSIVLLFSPSAYGIWGAMEGEHSAQYLAREIREETALLQQGVAWLPDGHGIIRIPAQENTEEIEEGEEVPSAVPESCRLALAVQSANYGALIPFMQIKDNELVIFTARYSEPNIYRLEQCSEVLPKDVVDTLINYLDKAAEYAKEVPAEICGFVRVASALNPSLLSDTLLHVYIEGQYRYTLLGLPAAPAADNLPMERPVEAFLRWFSELQPFPETRTDTEWLLKTLIEPHFCPQNPVSTQNERDKEAQKG